MTSISRAQTTQTAKSPRIDSLASPKVEFWTEGEVPIRPDLLKALSRGRDTIGEAGTWWTGAQRVALWNETRLARSCQLCRERKGALSPSHVNGEHNQTSVLPAAAVDAVHRLTTDPGRLTKKLVEDWASHGLSDSQYVELVAVATQAIALDMFRHALGNSPLALPAPSDSEPSQYRPSRAANSGFFVPAIANGKASAAEADLYQGFRPANIVLALSLVPDELRSFKDLVAALYIPFRLVANIRTNGGRALDRGQMELLATRVSEVNKCFY